MKYNSNREDVAVRREREERVEIGKLWVPPPFVFFNTLFSFSFWASFRTSYRPQYPLSKHTSAQLSVWYLYLLAFPWAGWLWRIPASNVPCLWWGREGCKAAKFTLTISTWWLIHVDGSMWEKEHKEKELVRVEFGNQQV